MRYNVSTNWEPPYGPWNPCTRLVRTRLEKEVPQLDRAAPLKVRACRGTGEGWSVEVFTLGHALCRSYSKGKGSALTATPKFEGVPARDLQSARVARRFRLNTK